MIERKYLHRKVHISEKVMETQSESTLHTGYSAKCSYPVNESLVQKCSYPVNEGLACSSTSLGK